MLSNPKNVAHSMPPSDPRQGETICTSLLSRGRLELSLCSELASWRCIALALMTESRLVTWRAVGYSPLIRFWKSGIRLESLDFKDGDATRS